MDCMLDTEMLCIVILSPQWYCLEMEVKRSMLSIVSVWALDPVQQVRAAWKDIFSQEQSALLEAKKNQTLNLLQFVEGLLVIMVFYFEARSVGVGCLLKVHHQKLSGKVAMQFVHLLLTWVVWKGVFACKMHQLYVPGARW